MSNAIPLSDIGLEEHRVLMRDTKNIIYKITNTVNGKVYIGQTVRSFYVRYGGEFQKHHNNYLKNSIKKYGKYNFNVDILYKDLSVDDLNYYEAVLIQLYDSCNPHKGYNLKEGGSNGGKFSEEGLKYMRELKGKKTYINYKGNEHIFNSKIELEDFMKTTYGIKNCSNWFGKNKVVPYIYDKDVISCGYINSDGTILECSRDSKKRGSFCSKKVKLVFNDGVVIIKNSIRELMAVLKEDYNIVGTDKWSSAGIPYIYRDLIVSCGYLNSDGTVIEFKRLEKKRGNDKSKKVRLVLNNGMVIIKDSLREMNDYFSVTYGVCSLSGWAKKGIPHTYSDLIISLGYINSDGSITEFKRNYKCTECYFPSKKVRVCFTDGTVIIKDSLKDAKSYLLDTYNISGVSNWHKTGVPLKYQDLIASCGYINDDGSVQEFKLSNGLNRKKVKAIYKGKTIIKNSIEDFSEYMRVTYGLKGVHSWFKGGLPFKYRDDFESIGYLNTDGTVEECKRTSQKKGTHTKNRMIVIYKNEKVIKDSIKDIVAYFSDEYNMKIRDWFYRGVPLCYKDDVTFCGTYEDYLKLNDNNIVEVL